MVRTRTSIRATCGGSARNSASIGPSCLCETSHYDPMTSGAVLQADESLSVKRAVLMTQLGIQHIVQLTAAEANYFVVLSKRMY